MVLNGSVYYGRSSVFNWRQPGKSITFMATGKISNGMPNMPRHLQAKGYEVWMIDYRVLRKSSGKLTGQILYSYAEQLYVIAKQNTMRIIYIIIYGKVARHRV